MKDAQRVLELLLRKVSAGKPLVAQLLIQEGGTGKLYSATYNPRPRRPATPAPAPASTPEK